MQLAVFTEPELGCSYDQLLAVASTAEAGGWHGFFSADHFVSPAQAAEGPGPLDVWTTLAGLARDTERIRLGTLMTCCTFRLPGVLAVTVAQVDAMSNGRVELGLGAGHFEGEHRSYGIPFPPLGERFDRLEEQLEVLTGFWSTPTCSTFNYEGRYYQLEDCPALPKPAQVPRPRIIVGGRGPRRTPRIAARFADEMNFSYYTPMEVEEGIDRLGAACVEAGRDPTTMDFSVNLLLACGRTDGDVAARLAKVEAQMKRAASYRGIEDTLSFCAVGSPETVVDRLGCYHDLGISRVYLHFRDPNDLNQLDLVSSDVLPHLMTA